MNATQFDDLIVSFRYDEPIRHTAMRYSRRVVSLVITYITLIALMAHVFVCSYHVGTLHHIPPGISFLVWEMWPRSWSFLVYLSWLSKSNRLDQFSHRNRTRRFHRNNVTCRFRQNDIICLFQLNSLFQFCHFNQLSLLYFICNNGGGAYYWSRPINIIHVTYLLNNSPFVYFIQSRKRPPDSFFKTCFGT